MTTCTHCRKPDAHFSFPRGARLCRPCATTDAVRRHYQPCLTGLEAPRSRPAPPVPTTPERGAYPVPAPKPDAKAAAAGERQEKAAEIAEKLPLAAAPRPEALPPTLTPPAERSAAACVKSLETTQPAVVPPPDWVADDNGADELPF
jgi:hypothetical protein